GPGARGDARDRPRSRLRQRPPLDPPQIGGGDALPAHPPHPLGQALPRSRHARGTRKAADIKTPAADISVNRSRGDPLLFLQGIYRSLVLSTPPNPNNFR